MERISEADLIINSDGTIYHLNMLPEETPLTVILVGDPDRVPAVSKHFDVINVTKKSREFVIHIGKMNGVDLMVMSTGMGTDNIDIVLNELDALWNIDFATRKIKQNLRSAQIVRIGTTGSVNTGLDAGEIGFTQFAVGFDALWDWYQVEKIKIHPHLKPVALFSVSSSLRKLFESRMRPLTTATMPGFYGPQGRLLRLDGTNHLDIITKANVEGTRIDNLEMETAGIYGLSTLLGHEAISINAVLANRLKGTFSDNPEAIVKEAILTTLNIITHAH